jgi:hypothetical protein
MSGRFSARLLATCRTIALAMSLPWPAVAFAQSDSTSDTRLGLADLQVVLSAYVDGATELRQFLLACAHAEPAHWQEGAAMLVATARQAGLTESDVAGFERKLGSGKVGAADYDCAGDIARLRLGETRAADWLEYHKAAIAHIGIEIVMPGVGDDARLKALRAVFARHIPGQSRLLNCMALTEPQFFPTAYADWEGLLGKAAAKIAAVGYDAATVAAIVEPARSANLMTAPADRQAALADCFRSQDWMRRYNMMDWYLIVSDVDTALETSP